MFRKSFIASFLLFTLVSSTVTPLFVPKAQAFALSGALTLIGGAKLIPHVPTADTVKDLIDSVLNGAAIIIAQGLVNETVNSTIRWANTGFQGNPAFVTNPKQYFGNLANGLAGGFIKNSRAGFLCSPNSLQNTYLKISLANYYTQPYQPQCTLTGIGNNVDNFFDNFSAGNGGWDTFIKVTQESQNNPYGSFIDAQINLDKQLAAALGIEQKKLDWSQGFKSKGDCTTVYHAPSDQQIMDYENGVSGPGTIAGGDIPYDDSLSDGDCSVYGPDKTPGSVIKDELSKTVFSGMSQLLDVKKFDELIGALASGLLQRYVFGPQGLFSKNYAKGLPDSGDAQGSEPPKPLSCVPNITQATVGDSDTKVVWSANLSGVSGDVEYIWSGDEYSNTAQATTSLPQLDITYTTSGPKKMSVIARTYTTTLTAELSDPNDPNSKPTGNTIKTRVFKKDYPAGCDGAVQVANYPPLVVSCEPNALQSYFGDRVIWTAHIDGGSGKLARLEWKGQQSSPPKASDKAETHIWPDGLASDSNDLYAPTSLAQWNWKLDTPLSIIHIFAMSDGTGLGNFFKGINPATYVAGSIWTQLDSGHGASTETITHTKSANGLNHIEVKLERPYFKDNDPTMDANASVTVWDQDLNLQTITNHECTGIVGVRQH